MSKPSVDRRKIVTIVGARPQFIKAAAMRAVFDTSEHFKEVLVHTGQHYDSNMSAIFFQELGIRAPEYNLVVDARSHGAMTARMLTDIETILVQERPDAVLVYGDTDSTLAGALAAAKLNLPVVHIEAGLRSFNKRMPEEINRVLTDHLSSFLFCSTEAAVRNLSDESLKENVYVVGDIMYDVALKFGNKADLEALKFRYNKVGLPTALLTLHRAENFGDASRARRVMEFVSNYSERYNIVFPVHPGTKSKLSTMGISFPPNVQLVPPLPYIELQGLVQISELVLTDSGGLQKEAYFHRTPCITLRDETEWVETIEAGWNALWTNPVRPLKREIPDYGNGNTATLIHAILRDSL